MPVLDRSLSLRWLLDPVSPADFVATRERRQPRHIPGPAGKIAGVFSWDRCNHLLSRASTWTASKIRLVKDREVIPAGRYCRPATDRDLGTVLRPVPALIGEHLEHGATINVNEIQLLDERIASLGFSLAMAFAAHVNCNLYLSRRKVAAFPSHFDNSDLFVVHVAGAKRWRVYERPFQGAADIEGFTSGSYPQDYHDRLKGAVLMDLELTPGDVLYIPRGFYHDALASTEVSLHLTLGIDELRGISILEALQPLLARQGLFREPLPRPDDGPAHRDHLRRLGERLARILSEREVAERIAGIQKNLASWDMPGFSLPGAQFDELFRLRGWSARLERRDGATRLHLAGRDLALAEPHEPIVSWILAGDYFDSDSLVDAFPDASEGLLREVLATLLEQGVIEPLAGYAR